MDVRFVQADAAEQRFVTLRVVRDVTHADFERMRDVCESGLGQDDDIVADLLKDGDIVDTVLLSRQMHLRAAAELKATP